MGCDGDRVQQKLSMTFSLDKAKENVTQSMPRHVYFQRLMSQLYDAKYQKIKQWTPYRYS
jgi:hypothetical protein